ncbi:MULTISPECIES: ammonia-dependent NAD(+) synthetase [unclassified Streptomyces]|uniref:ammonia-dependent NAD(+) synthetase n=1 Tax=unclassified Streptomyces TaxID=2593676 RepID=UPI000880FB6B|nr:MULTISPECIES: ammonia-dependent NAD(+) synthetase [unclassified Streptomyces]PBC85169.1 NH(3)-dependent NAD(+) synthetase [Streptomyces sp. 2321.6]SDR20851.1 NAD+ synthase [Streptomyces sp. KS_16]SED58302.1 NAD+ synthase [Streptomyces sp. 2133.1]SEE25975.1 NAD+ synthase [Streptomyces sp. 2112.3]SNC71191.1 NAD+ synthase [Streptomyces sp. 2114.4]
MTDPASKALQQEIARDLQVTASFDAEQEIERRVAFLTERLTSTGLRSLVLGISGGVDSTTTGRLCQLAVERARAAGHEATFYAMRLPYGVQADEKDAQRALEFIRADRELTVDIRPASDAALRAAMDGGLVFRDAHHQDFVQGNIKARQRMIAQYAVAGAHDGLVVGTDHAAEAVSGFFTKFGDGAADVVPLTGLTKRRVRAVAAALGAPGELVHKVPTADLETLDPGKPDEDALGVSYDQIDDYLEGHPVDAAAAYAIVRRYRLTEHKRALPIAP